MKNYASGIAGKGVKNLFFLGPEQALFIVAILNLVYFFIELFLAEKSGSLSLYADSVDFMEDALSGFLILLTWSLSSRARAATGRVLSVLLLIPCIAFLLTAICQLMTPVPPEAWLLSTTGSGALIVNSTCALLVQRFRINNSPVTLSAFLTARNDVLASIGLILTGLVTAYWHSAWPDILAGTAIFILNLDAAKTVWRAATSLQ